MAIGADDQLEQLGRQLVRAAGGAADDEGRVLAAVTGLIGQRALIPIIDATGRALLVALEPIVGDLGDDRSLTAQTFSPSPTDVKNA